MGLPESRTPGLKQQLHQGCNDNCVRDKQEAGVRDLQKGDTTSQKPLVAGGKSHMRIAQGGFCSDSFL